MRLLANCLIVSWCLQNLTRSRPPSKSGSIVTQHSFVGERQQAPVGSLLIRGGNLMGFQSVQILLDVSQLGQRMGSLHRA